MGRIILNETDYHPITTEQRDVFFSSLGVRRRNNGYALSFEDRNYNCMPYLQEALESNVHGLSFFSGAGGLDIGAQMAKIKVISSLDFERDAVETMRANKFFSHTQHFHEDIRNIKASDFSSILKKNNPEKRSFKVWISRILTKSTVPCPSGLGTRN